jgi:protein TonB
MTRPKQLEGDPIEYTREAREAHVAGLMLVKCVIQTDGALKDCKIVKTLPHMGEAVLHALSTWKMTPVTFQGRAVPVSYVIQLRLKSPNG